MNIFSKYTHIKRIACLLVLFLTGMTVARAAHRFFNLTSDQVSVDSVIPSFAYSVHLPDGYQDSVYTSEILYPEFIDMSELDIANFKRLGGDLSTMPSLPEIKQNVLLDRRQADLMVSFCPLVYRDGKYQILVSFMLRVDSKIQSSTLKVQSSTLNAQRSTFNAQRSTFNVQSSVLKDGVWAKIRVPSTGVYQLTEALIRRAGFSDLSKVHVYGYGGNLQNEILDSKELAATDDLPEVATCTINGRRFFYAKGPVSWESNTAARRTRNPYSDYGYYFLTENDSTPLSVDSTTFVNSFYPSADDYHSLYENDGYSWYHGGRNLYDKEATALGKTRRLILSHPKDATSGKLSVNISAGANSSASVSVNGKELGTLYVNIGSYDRGNDSYNTNPWRQTFDLDSLSAADTVKIKVLTGGPIRLDYVSVAWDKPATAPDFHGSFPVPEYVYNITNQNHHADPQADMVIIIPTSQKLLAQAQRLATFHEQHDGLRVNIVPADELYNEFSSGTPDANAYRRYMKMLYDRAETEADMPKYLLLFGGGVWDNRMLTEDCAKFNPDDYLLCYESENSFNEVECYVDDGYFTYLDDGEGVNLTSTSKTDKSDVAVGRFPVTTEEEAKAMVDKAINYATNHNAGAWQNVIMFMGDDGNDNEHMTDCDGAAEQISGRHPAYQIKKVMWDAYNEVTSSTGNRYPEVSNIIKQQQQQGALIMDYVGHGRADWMSHEAVLTLNDFKSFNNTNLPLWITASCDIMAFDGLEETIGTTAVTSDKGGAIGFFGTTRTVYAYYNDVLNRSFLRHVLQKVNGKPITIGEAARLAKNEMITLGYDRTTNKLQYSLLGDPAIALNQPTGKIVIDSINGEVPSENNKVEVKAGQITKVVGHIDNGSDFNGTVTLSVLDSRQQVTCHGNKSAQLVNNDPFTYYNRANTVFSGSDNVDNGKFSISFAVPFDLNYDGGAGRINAFAVSKDNAVTAHGYSEGLVLGSGETEHTDTLGPKIFCYLNDPDFVNGDDVNTTPYFVAQLKDESGINATGNGVGHNLELIIDGEADKTYTLNNNFNYDFGSYTSGNVYFSIPTLEPGQHSLLFRAWDTMNNTSTRTLQFNVVKSLEPTLYNIDVTKNPASTSTTFIVSHSFAGSPVDVRIDVFDMSGRLLWTHAESGTQLSNTYTINWNLTQDNGARLQTGVYLYRVRLSSDGSSVASKAKKLVVISNN